MPLKPRKATSRRRFWGVIVVVAVVLLGGVGALIWNLMGAGSAASPGTERTVKVTRQPVKDAVGATGTVQPKRQADISFASSGTVTAVKVSVGTKVTKGQKLATIDDTDLDADLTAAEADYAAAKDDLATAQDDSDTTTAELNAAKSKVAVGKSKVSQAKTALAAATLRSPITGTVALVNIAKGDSVGSSGSAAGTSSSTGSSSADLTVISTGTYTVDTAVGSADVAKIKKGMPATITVSGSTDPIVGTVSSVAVMASSASSATTSGGSATFDVGIDLPGRQPKLYAGATATVAITVEERPNVLTVPTAAISTTNGKTTVNKLVDGKKVSTEITIGDSFGATTEVTKGLAEGDEVVVTFANRGAGTGTGTGQGGNPNGQGGFGGGGNIPRTETREEGPQQPAGPASQGTR